MRVRGCSLNFLNRADSSSGGRGGDKEGEGEEEYWVRLSDVTEVRIRRQGSVSLREKEEEVVSMDPTHDTAPAPTLKGIATHQTESPSSSLSISISRSHDIHHSVTSLDTFCAVPTASNGPCDPDGQDENGQEGDLPSLALALALAADLNTFVHKVKRTRRQMRRAGKQCALPPSLPPALPPSLPPALPSSLPCTLDLNAMHDNLSLHCAVGGSSSLSRSSDNDNCDDNADGVSAAQCSADEGESDMTNCTPSPSAVQTSLHTDDVAASSFADLFSDMLSCRRSQMDPD